MINMGAVRALTARFGQYFAYKETVDLIAIFNTFDANAIKLSLELV
jgi:hypothetical protein